MKSLSAMPDSAPAPSAARLNCEMMPVSYEDRPSPMRAVWCDTVAPMIPRASRTGSRETPT